MNQKDTENIIPNVNSKEKEERNVPDLRNKTIALKDLCMLITKGTTAKKFVGNGINFIKIESINSIYEIDENKISYVTEYEHNNYLKRSKLEENDILFSIAGALGIVHIVSKDEIPANTNQALAIIRLKNKSLTNFVSYFLQSKEIKCMIRDIKSIGAQPNLSLRQVGDFKIKFPANYNIITNLMLNLDKQISTQKKIIEDFKCLNNAIIHRMKVEASSSQPFKLVDIANYYNGIAHENDVTKSGYILINSKFISSDGQTKKYCETAHFPLIKNDICIVLSDLPNGKALAKCFFIDENNKYTLNQRIACVRSKNIALSKYLYYYINRNSYFLKFDDGVNQTNLSKENILEFRIKIHTNYEKYVYLLDKINNKINDEKKILSLYEKQKQYLLNNMFI